MRTILCFIFLVITTLSVIAQDKLIALHSVVGDTIDKREQKEFLLFSDIVKEDFSSLSIYVKVDKYFLHINSKSGADIVEVELEVIKENQEHVEKLTQYFKSLLKRKDSLKLDLKLADNWPTFESSFLSDEQRKHIAKEARAYFSLNQAAESRGLVGIEKENYIKVNSECWLTEILFEILK